MHSPDRRFFAIPVSLGRLGTLGAILLAVVASGDLGVTWAQENYDDHELTDRFYITLGGYSQDDLRTSLRIDALAGGVGGAGAVILLESLFAVDDQVTTGRLDGWYRFNKKHRIGWTYWRTNRSGVSTYGGDEPIQIGDQIINPGDSITTVMKSELIAAEWTRSFINKKKYEAWLGVGLNFQTIDTVIDVDVGGGGQFQESVKATVPIPTLNFGGRYNFGERWRMLLTSRLFGLKIGDFSGRLANTRVLAEFDITKHFGFGGGLERFNFEVNAASTDFHGQMDTSYSAFTLYLKGQV